MKKINQFALGFAIALTGAAGFTACSSEENMDVNPSYNKQTGELNVDFVFNISTLVIISVDSRTLISPHLSWMLTVKLCRTALHR